MTLAKNNFLGRGWAFPIRPGPDGRIPLNTGEEAIRNSIFLILSTAPGERLMRRDFGCGIHDLVFQANSVSLRAAVQIRVEEALVKWEPRIDVLGVSVETSPEARHHLNIRVDYRIRSNNALFNLVYPYFLQEGAA